MESRDIESLLASENTQLQKLNDIVARTIEEEKLILNNLLNPPKETLTQGQKLSDRLTRFGGSWIFISLFMLFLAAWIVYNISVPKGESFDPYPFILMNLVLSCLAALQAPVIMMSQNRQEEKDRKRAENDYMVNLKAELEIRSLHEKIDLLLQEQMKMLYDIQVEQTKMLKNIEDRVNGMK